VSTILDARPQTVVPVFGDRKWIAKARVSGCIDGRMILRAARVRVDRTPMYAIRGEPDPMEEREFPYLAHVIDHDPIKYAPYTDLVGLRRRNGREHRFFLVELV
jgi:hypothetical protein